MRWIENSFYDNLDKFANSLGYENFHIAIPMAMIPWESTQERDVFIMTITGADVKGGTPSTFNPLEVK